MNYLRSKYIILLFCVALGAFFWFRGGYWWETLTVPAAFVLADYLKNVLKLNIKPK